MEVSHCQEAEFGILEINSETLREGLLQGVPVGQEGTRRKAFLTEQRFKESENGFLRNDGLVG